MLVQQSYQIQQLDHIPSSLLEEMLAFIKNNLSEHQTLNVLTRSKFILTELVTNAIKHAASSITDITIQVTGTSIRFIKSDKGKRLIIPKIKNEFIKDGVVITADMMHTLYAVNKNDRMHFYCYEHEEPVFDDQNSYPEHFGLLIITKSSDEFFYTHNNAENMNVFSAAVNF